MQALVPASLIRVIFGMQGNFFAQSRQTRHDDWWMMIDVYISLAPQTGFGIRYYASNFRIRGRKNFGECIPTFNPMTIESLEKILQILVVNWTVKLPTDPEYCKNYVEHLYPEIVLNFWFFLCPTTPFLHQRGWNLARILLHSKFHPYKCNVHPLWCKKKPHNCPLSNFSVFSKFSAWRCWLGGRKGIRPVKNWVVGCWCGYVSRSRSRFAYGPADVTATHCLLLQ